MRLCTHFPAIAAGLLTCLFSLSVSPICRAGDPPVPQGTPDTNTAPATAAVEEALRQLKEQQASTSEALELILDHTETALNRNAMTVSNQLAQFSVALADYSNRQFQLMRSTESRTLRVTLFILLVVVLTAAALLLLAARALRSLMHRFSASPIPFGLEPAPIPQSLLDQAAESAYAAAVLDVEKRIAALEIRQACVPAASAAPAETAAPQTTAQAVQRPSSPVKFRSAPLALALGSGEALVFLPRDRPPHTANPVVAALGRISRIFQRTPSASKGTPGPKSPKV